MTHDQKNKPSTGFWIAVALVVVLAAYPLSFGPACWITSRAEHGAELVPIVYRPVTWGLSVGSTSVLDRVILWYARIGAARGWSWQVVLNDRSMELGWEWVSLPTY